MKAEEHAHKKHSRVDLVKQEFTHSRVEVHKKGKGTE